jgi:CheY-like chemotaxis protein
VAADLLTGRCGSAKDLRADPNANQRLTSMGDVQTTKRTEESIGWSRIADEVTSEGSETILFVEDEAFVRDVTCEVLRSAGYRVLSAKNALEAERAYDQSSDEVDLLLADVVLPGETGRVFAARLRRKNPALKVLLVTGYGEQMGTREGSQEECLAKPFSAEVLLRRVRQRLDSGERPIANEDSIRHACDTA